MSTKRYSEADYRRAIDQQTRRTVEESKKAGRPVSVDKARAEAVERARRVQRQREK